MEITASMVKELRERTGAGILDCRKALQESDGDFEAAGEYLRKKSLATAEKKAGRVAAEGLVYSYIHGNGRIGVLVEVNCETDFVAKTDQFETLAKDVAMHIAAMSPIYVDKDEVSEAAQADQRRFLTEQAAESGKPAQVIEKMVDGRMNKWLEEVCLLDQSFVKDPDKSVREMLNEKVAKIGENIKVRRFVRYELGEGIEKRSDDFAAEVAAAVSGS